MAPTEAEPATAPGEFADDPLDNETAMREAFDVGVIRWLADRVSLDRMRLAGDAGLLDALGQAAEREASRPRDTARFAVCYSLETGVLTVEPGPNCTAAVIREACIHVAGAIGGGGPPSVQIHREGQTLLAR
jgi:hypothetical protein